MMEQPEGTEEAPFSFLFFLMDAKACSFCWVFFFSFLKKKVLFKKNKKLSEIYQVTVPFFFFF